VTVLRDNVDFADEVAGRVSAGERFAGLYATATDAGMRLTALLAAPGDVRPVDVWLPGDATGYPALTPTVPAASWYERALHDLTGIVPDGHPRLDPLLLPLGRDADDGGRAPARPRPGGPPAPERITPTESPLPRHVGGQGVFTIPYGPVRGGVHESVEYVVETPGEDIPHLRVRVAAKHRGVEKRFEALSADDGVYLAERTEGIASVAHALAYSHAIERLAGVDAPRTAALVRVLHAELERVANHLDVAIGLAEAAGLVVAVSRFGWHKERVLRLAGRLCGSRFGRSVVVPGGVRGWPLLSAAQTRAELDALAGSLSRDVDELMGTSTFLDRLRGTGPLSPQRAAEYGALGPIGRASDAGEDARLARPYDGYRILRSVGSARLWRDADRVRHDAGDAQERLRVRWEEVAEALDLARQAVDALDGPAAQEPLAVPLGVPDGRGIGWAEAPQGEVLYAVDVAGGRIRRCVPRSASFHNLALFPAVFAGDIFTDFAFIEASFGLSIAGAAL
jgi:Ni,Fe-hydrogenase III large subunit